MKKAWEANKKPEAIAKRAAKKRIIKPEVAKEIRRRLATGERQTKIAKELGIPTPTMSNFVNHKYGY
jgi:DNA invertase Pin-like site-specific DNA recombinase